MIPVANAGIYRIVHRESGKSYVGSSGNLLNRWRKHQSSANAGKHRTPHLQNAVNLYEWAAFDFVIEENAIPDGAYLLAREQVYIDAASQHPAEFYNICLRAGSGPGHRGDKNGARLHPERIPRGARAGRNTHPECTARGERCRTTKLTAEQVREIRGLYAGGGVRQVEIGEAYGIVQSVVSAILRRETWAHVD